MIRFAVLSLVAAVSAVGAAQAVVALDPARGATALVAPVFREAAAAPASGQPAMVTKARDGHYWAHADVNGRQVRFLVDTGASAVALTLADARRLGIDVEQLDYRHAVLTASGQARAASVQLGAVSVAGARVENVDALVIPEGLDASLLGMSYLGRLSRFEATPTTLVLRP